MFGFILILASVMSFAWFFIWWRLVYSSELPAHLMRGLSVAIVVMLILQIITPILWRWVDDEERLLIRIFLWISYTCLGLMVLLFFSSIVREVFLLISTLIWAIPDDPERRLFLVRSFNLSALTLGVGATAWGLKTAVQGPYVKNVEVPIENLHPDLDGFKIAQISDLHVGALIRRDYVENVVAQTKALGADLIALTGDIADGASHSLTHETEPLGWLTAPQGVYYVTGNHEYYWNVDAWIQQMKDFNFNYLYNENRILSIGGAKLLIGGVPDYSCQRIRTDHESNPLKASLSSGLVDLKILLAHQPKSCFKASDAGFDLMLSGHTHGGQFFPLGLFAGLFNPYLKGLNRHQEKMWVYVNRATGFWGPPVRTGNAAEITFLKLKRVVKA